MYHISLYFDENTDKRLRGHIKEVASASGNTYMTDECVPPHITVAAFQCKDCCIEDVTDALDEAISQMGEGKVYFAGLGQFLPGVLYANAVYSEYLHNICSKVNETLTGEGLGEIELNPYYRPFNWLPHVTIGKMLSKEQLICGIEALQNSWGAFGGKVKKIGLAKTNPYKDIKLWILE